MKLTNPKILNLSFPTLDFYTKRLSVFDVHFENTKLNFEIEDLHKLRVEIKKQRAFYRFLEGLAEGNFYKLEHFLILATIYKPGGRLRETQVNRLLVKLYRSYSLDGYKKFLSKRNKRQTKKFKKALAIFDQDGFGLLNAKVSKLLSEVDSGLVREKSYGFINSELESIRALSPLLTGDDELHQIRTHTKALGYITKFINELHPTQQFDDLLQNAKPTEKLIGNWHDRVVLVNSLKRYLSKYPDAPDKPEAEKLIRQINYRNTVSVKIIANRLDGFIDTKL